MEAAVEKRAITQLQQHRLRPLIDAAATMVKQRGGMVRLEELTKAVLCKGRDGDKREHYRFFNVRRMDFE